MSAGGPAALACSQLTRRYGRLVALRSVTFSVAPGECLTLFGHNGAGKSTLLNTVAGLARGYDGDVRVFGVDIRRADDGSRGAVGLVAHETFLYSDLSARDNLVFFGRLYRVGDPGARADELLERFRLTHKGGANVRALSRGMKQRLSLARAIVHEPRLLLLDEPFTGLDEAACELVSGMLREFVAGGGAVVVTTHDMERGHGVADRIAVLHQGSIVLEHRVADMDLASFRSRYRDVLEGRQ